MVRHMETKEKERIEIRTTPLTDKVMENIELLQNVLTQWENFIVGLLMIKSPLTVKGLRNQAIDQMSRYWFRVSKDNYDSFAFSDKTITPDDKKRFKKEYTKQIELGQPTYLLIKSLEQRLDEILGIKVPSYKKFKRCLESLQNMGIVAMRIDPMIKKGNVLWFLNPVFVKAYKKYFSSKNLFIRKK